MKGHEFGCISTFTYGTFTYGRPHATIPNDLLKRPFPYDHQHTTLLRPFPHESSHTTTPMPTTTPIQYPSYSLFKRPFSNDQSHTSFFKQPFPYGHSHITIRTRPFPYDHYHATILIGPPFPYDHHPNTTTHIRSTPYNRFHTTIPLRSFTLPITSPPTNSSSPKLHIRLTWTALTRRDNFIRFPRMYVQIAR